MRLWQVSRTLFVPLWTVWGVWGCEGMWWWTVYISVQVFRDLWTKYWWYFQVFLCKWQTSNLGEHVSMATYLPDLSRHSQWVCVMCVCVMCICVLSQTAIHSKAMIRSYLRRSLTSTLLAINLLFNTNIFLVCVCMMLWVWGYEWLSVSVRVRGSDYSKLLLFDLTPWWPDFLNRGEWTDNTTCYCADLWPHTQRCPRQSVHAALHWVDLYDLSKL